MPGRRRTAALSFLGFVVVLGLAIFFRPQNETLLEDKKTFPPLQDGYYGDIVGIELGRTYSRVGIMRNKTLEIITDDQGRTTVPSYVAFTDKGETLVGFEAMRQAGSNLKSTIYDVRRLIGRDFSDPSLQDDILRLPYEVVDKEGKPVIKVDVKDADIYLTPEEISAKVIEKLKYMAQEHLNRTVASAVLTVPSYFNEKQLQATKDAAVIAGLNALRLVKEPTAAGIAHGLERQNDQTFNIILNLGAKELDVALADVELGVYEILANATDTTLGGEDITSNEFLELEEDFGNQALGLVKRVLKEGKVGKIAINDIIFTGNPTHISKIQPFIEAHFDGKKALYTNGVHPEEAIVRGAALQGAVLSGNYEDICSMPLLDVVRLSLGIETSGGIFTKIIPRHTIIPTRKIHEFTTVTKGQNTVVVDIFDGERAVASANKALGRLQLSGLSREPTIQVTFEIDANEILTVAVKDKGTGNEVSFGWPVGRERYTWEESDQIVMDAEKYWDADQLLLKEGPANIEEWNKQHSFGLRSLS